MSGASRRDEFSAKVKATLAQRVNYLCSKPGCHEFTSGPHSDSDKPVILGVAAHICAAAVGGPRYDPNQTRQDRKKAANGIWLCLRHAKEIDSDVDRHPASLLHEWKAATEAFALGNDPSPSFPLVSLQTLAGFRLIRDRIINSENEQFYRDHEFTLENTSRLDFRDVQIRVQFPELLYEFATIEACPADSNISVQIPRAAIQSVAVPGQGGAGSHWNLTPRRPDEPRPLLRSDVLIINVSRLPALQRIAITLISSSAETPVPDREALENNSGGLYRYKIVGRLAFDWNREVRHLNT